MNFRSVKEFDIPQLARLQREHPDFHELNINKYLIDGVVADSDENVVAYGIVIPFAEAVFLPDISRSKEDKVIALRTLMRHAIYGTEKAGIKQLHCFIKDDGFAEVMKKHYGFKPCEGQALVLNLGD